ncbi:MAG TPA: hypothetical protein VJ476_02535 [Rhizomicrobium sp.]|nr:hypothetical protein [Rhizomicrobium sp.]
MADPLADLLPTPLRYAQKFDLVRDALFFFPLDEASYRAASFLDDRLLTPGLRGDWVDFALVDEATQGAVELKPLHIIFHTGHVGSTLLSRLIDETGYVLGLREPLPLRTLAEMQDAAAPAFADRFATLLKLWSRGFADTSAVVLKATSTAARLAPALLSAAPQTKAVYLNLRPEAYLATLLAGANVMVDLEGFEVERTKRLRSLLGESSPQAVSIGERVARTWLVESLTRARALEGGGSRILPLDFDAMLANLPATIAAVLAHFGIAAPPDFAQSIARSKTLTRYSKAPQQFEYSPQFRAQLLAQARRDHAAEIGKGMVLLERLARKDPRVAALL